MKNKRRISGISRKKVVARWEHKTLPLTCQPVGEAYVITGMNMTLSPTKTICSLILFSILSFLLSGCAFLQLKEEAEFAKKSVVLVGVVSSPLTFSDTPVVVAAYSK